jgi:aspartyl protease family protein
MRTIVFIAALVLAAGVFIARMADRQTPPAALAAQPAPTPAPATNGSNSRAVTLSRGNGGHFWTDARIDGRRLELVVDTGASVLTLRASDAARLGIHPAARDYNVKVSTANGVTKAALVQLNTVEVGDIVVRNVPALIHADDQLAVNLLGMSFLSRIRWTHERGKLILEQ